ncbi:MAG TPA: hypothetical protein VLW65_25050 [Bryobacteraceae bacterium]|nr:hypothetical protein [Bryobacteraceae bacterium]
MSKLEQLRRLDPLRRGIRLPLKGTYHPGGFCVEIATNSEDVLASAGEAWGHSAPEYGCDPLKLRVLVQPEGRLAQQPSHRMQGHMYAIVSDAHNFAQVDLASQLGCIWASEQTAADHPSLRCFFLECSVYVMLSQRHIVAVHAACVVRNGAGILLSGSSGAGKSSLSYACARAGWTFVADDATWLLAESDSRMAIGHSRRARFRPDAPALFPELERYAVRARPNGRIGIEVPLAELPHIRAASRAPIRAVVFLERGGGEAGAHRLTGAESADRLLADMPSYGDATDAMHERTVRRLAGVPAWRMHYTDLEEGIRILGNLAI